MVAAVKHITIVYFLIKKNLNKLFLGFSGNCRKMYENNSQ